MNIRDILKKDEEPTLPKKIDPEVPVNPADAEKQRKMQEISKKAVSFLEGTEPLLEWMGIDKRARGKIIVSLLTKGKLPNGLMTLFGGKDSRTRMEKFWDGLSSGLPFILSIYGLLMLTLLLHKWGLI